jgi:flagellum-specific ATP synthase
VTAQAATILERVRDADWVKRTGRVSRFVGLTVEAKGPDCRIGEICEIYSAARATKALAEVVGFAGQSVLLMPYEHLADIEVGSEVVATGRTAVLQVGDQLLGRVIDGFAAPLDGEPLATGGTAVPLYPRPLNPLERGLTNEILETGVRSIDTLLTLARGQRIGIFSGAGVGKSTLLRMIARHVQTDVAVIALVGERGREVKSFVEKGLTPEARKRTVVVAATSDEPPLVRRRAAFLATAIAEHFRARGQHVCLAMDSITRVAMAQREIGLASGELPTSRGYTPSVFSLLTRLLERGGVHARGGTLTALYTVLVDGDDLNDPIADSTRAILDGHIVLSRAIAHRNVFPAIDVIQSVSRQMPEVVSEDDLRMIGDVNKILATYRSSQDLIEVGAYRPGSNAVIDRAIRLVPNLEAFLSQTVREVESRGAALARVRAILAEGGAR